MIKVIGIPFDSNSSFLKGPAHAPTRIGLMEHEGSAAVGLVGGEHLLLQVNMNPSRTR